MAQEWITPEGIILEQFEEESVDGTTITAELPKEFRIKAEEIFGKDKINGIEWKHKRMD